MDNFIEAIRKAAKKKIVYTEHALNEMNAEEDVISVDEVRQVIFDGEIIEDYLEDKRGHSCLMSFHVSKDRPIHVVCSPKSSYLGIITAYAPLSDRWNPDFKTRRY